MKNTAAIGDVFQVNESHGRTGWIGALVIVTRVATWGIQGFVAQVKSRDEQQHAFIRLLWDEIEYVGHAPLVPVSADELEDHVAPPHHK